MNLHQSDRELLELAAKASGINASWHNPTKCLMVTKAGSGLIRWNPLIDDGDALRLAAKLKLHFERYDDCIAFMPNYSSEYSATEDIISDPYGPTRRAIVRAAARIGKDMK